MNKLCCPNSSCLSYQTNNATVRDGHYTRKGDGQRLKRYRCTQCGKRFSYATGQLTAYQKKRSINTPILKLLCSGVSQRRAALVLETTRATIKRKIIYLSEVSQREQAKRLSELAQTPVPHIQMDDLITKEHTKLKPLSVSIVVSRATREILGATVSQIPAFGHLSKMARKKYGPRPSHHYLALDQLFKRLQSAIAECAVIESDEHSFYPLVLKKYLPQAKHLTYKSDRGCITGQGELKKVKFDPLFTINHTCAMFRDNIKALARKTWCICKKPEMLQHLIHLYIKFHNQILLA